MHLVSFALLWAVLLSGIGIPNSFSWWKWQPNCASGAVVAVPSRAALGSLPRMNWFSGLSTVDVFEGAMIPDPSIGVTPLGFEFLMSGGGDGAFQIGTAGRRGFINGFTSGQSLISSYGKSIIALDFLGGTVTRFGIEVTAREPGPFVAFMEVWDQAGLTFYYLTAPGIASTSSPTPHHEGPWTSFSSGLPADLAAEPPNVSNTAFLGFYSNSERINRVVLGLESAMNDLTWDFWISEPSLSDEATPEPSSLVIWCLLFIIVAWCRQRRIRAP